MESCTTFLKVVYNIPGECYRRYVVGMGNIDFSIQLLRSNDITIIMIIALNYICIEKVPNCLATNVSKNMLVYQS